MQSEAMAYPRWTSLSKNALHFSPPGAMPANAAYWRLVLSFRAAGPEARSFWALYPLESTSRSALYSQADRIPVDRLAAILSEHLG